MLITYIKNIAKGIGVISKARKYLDTNFSSTPYYSFLYLYFDNCIEVQGSVIDSHIETLIKIK